MINTILEKIESLPPLPKTIIEIEEFRRQKEKDPDELLSIIEKDALITSTLLKVSNSAMFGFRSKVETPKRAISLLGVNFTISLAISGTIQNLLVSDLKPYNSSSDDFMRTTSLSSVLVQLWVAKFDKDLKEELFLPALLQESGKFILSDIVCNEKRVDEFKSKLEQFDTSDVEKQIIGLPTSEVTAKIFEHWKLSDNLINLIKYVDDTKNADSADKIKVQILDVIKTACDITAPLSEENKEQAIQKAKDYKLDHKALEKSIDQLEERLLDE